MHGLPVAKEMLLKVFKRDFASKLIDEHLRLEA